MLLRFGAIVKDSPQFSRELQILTIRAADRCGGVRGAVCTCRFSGLGFRGLGSCCVLGGSYRVGGFRFLLCSLRFIGFNYPGSRCVPGG